MAGHVLRMKPDGQSGRAGALANRTRAQSSQNNNPEMKDPSGGTTGRVKPYGALGVDGRSRRIQPMGRDFRSHTHWSPRAYRTFKTAGKFFNYLGRNFRTKNYCADRRLLSITAALSEAMAAPGGLKSRVVGISFCSETFSRFSGCGTVATGVVDELTMA